MKYNKRRGFFCKMVKMGKMPCLLPPPRWETGEGAGARRRRQIRQLGGSGWLRVKGNEIGEEDGSIPGLTLDRDAARLRGDGSGRRRHWWRVAAVLALGRRLGWWGLGMWCGGAAPGGPFIGARGGGGEGAAVAARRTPRPTLMAVGAGSARCRSSVEASSNWFVRV